MAKVNKASEPGKTTKVNNRLRSARPFDCWVRPKKSTLQRTMIFVVYGLGHFLRFTKRTTMLVMPAIAVAGKPIAASTNRPSIVGASLIALKAKHTVTKAKGASNSEIAAANHNFRTNTNEHAATTADTAK